MEKVTVIGTTTWGTTLGIIIARKNIPVTMLARTPRESGELESRRQNSRFLPGVEFPESLRVSHDPEEALYEAGMVILAVPSGSFRDNVRRFRGAIDRRTIILSASKGLDMETGKRMSQVLEEELPPGHSSGICVLSGPNLALEIAEGKPASTVVASRQPGVAVEAQKVLMSPSFRVYTNEDIIGVELGGALKNVITLGAGICDGLGYGDNGKAAFITRGLAEITRLGVAAGASPITFAGLAGLGDLVATCASSLSRNHFVGQQLADGKPLEEILVLHEERGRGSVHDSGRSQDGRQTRRGGPHCQGHSPGAI